MNYIKKIELTNFQKHTKFVADLINGINIIHGATDAGKSCIVRAIRWVILGEPQGDIVRKEGTKKTSVKLTLKNDIIIERIKSKSKNAYRIIQGEDIKEYNAVGKSVPDDIKTIFGIEPFTVNNESIVLNIANQISLPFLMDKSATFRMKLFNKITGNDIIDKVFQSLNKDILNNNKVKKLEEEHLEDIKSELEKITQQHTELNKKYGNYKNLIDNVKKLKEKLTALTELRTEIEKLTEEKHTLTNQIGDIKIIDKTEVINLKKLSEKIVELELLRENLEAVEETIKITKSELNKIKITNIDVNKYKSLADKYNQLINIRDKYMDLVISCKQIRADIETMSRNIVQGQSNYKIILKQLKICPLCKQEIK